MAQNPINWFPGHMAKTRRIIKECLKDVDIVIEVCDARIPYSSKNPETDEITKGKKRVIALAKASLADEKTTEEWIKKYKSSDIAAVAIDSPSGYGLSALGDAVRSSLSDKLEKYKNSGMEGRKIRAMVIGIPNVGKSTLINSLAGAKKAKAENMPGVTLRKQWVPTSSGLDLLDMPGVLWPKFQDEEVGRNLAFTGAIKDTVLDTEELAMYLAKKLLETAPDKLFARYKLTEEECAPLDSYDLLSLIGKKRGFLMSGGEIDLQRTAKMLLNEFRSAEIGRISLEKPGDRR